MAAPGDDRRYIGGRIDGGRWDRFAFRAGDVIIATPSKCGTTWTQHIAVRLLRGAPALELPISESSPWLDMTFDEEADLFARLGAETGRRILKTHAPLDGVPIADGVTVLTVLRHPLDAAMSDIDHDDNADPAGVASALGLPPPEPGETATPPDRGERLRTYINDRTIAGGTGPRSLDEYVHYVRQIWSRRDHPAVHLFHYQDLWDDLPGAVMRIASVLGVDASRVSREEAWFELTLDAMRERADVAAPEGHRGIWRSAPHFFRKGGRREWVDILSQDEVIDVERRLAAALADLPLDDAGRSAAHWALRGGAALHGSPRSKRF